MRKGNCNRLEEGSLESFYWLGFLLADAHFSNKNRITVSLSRQDSEHLIKLADFLNTTIKYTTVILKSKKYEQCKLSIMHTSVINNITKKYNIDSNKTKNPPNLNILNDEELFACSIGFLDGDGSIGYQYKRKDCIIRIKCDASWNNLLLKLYPDFKHKITTDGYSLSQLSNSVIIKQIKKKCLDLKLPLLKRKWNKIDLNLVGRTEKAQLRKKEIKILYDQNNSIKQISNKLNLKYGSVAAVIRRNKL